MTKKVFEASAFSPHLVAVGAHQMESAAGFFSELETARVEAMGTVSTFWEKAANTDVHFFSQSSARHVFVDSCGHGLHFRSDHGFELVFALDFGRDCGFCQAHAR